MDTRKIIDYMQADDAAKAREALYAAIHDRVHEHLAAKKEEIARNLVGQEEVVEEEAHPDEKEDKDLVKKMVKKDCLKTEEVKKSVEHLGEATMSRKHFQMVADTLKAIPDASKRQEMANHHAMIFAQSNPRFDHARFHAAAGTKYEK